jgi:Cu+-exporting ATPase
MQFAEAWGGPGWLEVDHFEERAGHGVSGIVAGRRVRIGNGPFAGPAGTLADSGTYVTIGGESKGLFHAGHTYRPGLEKLARRLQVMGYRTAVITGDHDREKERLLKIFGPGTEIRFDQSPHDKLDYVKGLQAQGHKVLMLGDGLNDAGALMESDVGISVSDGVNNFTPAADGILDAAQLGKLAALLRYGKAAIHIITAGFILSLVYNVIGLSFAVQGTLSPVIAAILMPISTVTLVLFAVAASWVRGKRLIDA